MRNITIGAVDQDNRFLNIVYLTYFSCGLAQCIEGIFLPEFKSYFGLTYTQQMYIMFAKNFPFAVFSIPLGYFVYHFGYKIALASSVVLFSLGTLLIVPSIAIDNFALLLLAFFVIGLAFNLELVAGNPLLVKLGAEHTSTSRLNIGNALGAIAQIMGPLVVTFAIPGTARTFEQRLMHVNGLFVVTSIVLALLALIISLTPLTVQHRQNISVAGSSSHLSNKRVVLGVLTIFFVIGTEACFFGFFRNYLESPAIAGLTARQSQQLFTAYFALFALGRLAGSYLQKRMKPENVLIAFLVVASILILVVINGSGLMSIISILLVGFFISIFFPTLYAFAIEGSGGNVPKASGLIMTAFLGGAIIPVLQGKIADQTSLSLSFSLALVSYGIAIAYVQYFRSDRLK